MKGHFFPIFVLLLVLISCKEDPDPQAILASKVIFLGEEVCCSNFEVKGIEPIYSDLAGHSHNLLMAVNIEAYIQALDLKPGDSVSVNFVFTEKPYECRVICNRLDGFRIELMAAKKL